MSILNIEIDGKTVQVPPGSTVMDAANQVGCYVPHFCYHKKLSIAANCRMCLVQVEKAPKPMPACATPVTDGMKVHTQSEQAKKAQKGVMEFLLINHPLDCPICDQGGECQLQDLAVGYGGSSSRYNEPKRVVFHKDVGPLISMQEMTRCIHCTRCVRFGQEVAGQMELGMGGRGEHSEIQSFVGRTVDSELSGNMIDVCPVGALTSKPFRYSARTWELQRRKSVSPHDGLGSNLTVQVKGNQVMRVLPFENEAVNECWISDRDRFSYEALNSNGRLTTPMLKQNGQWSAVSWQVALAYAAETLSDIKKEKSADQIGVWASPHSTLEELAMLKRLADGLGTPHIDARLRMTDSALDQGRTHVPWLGMSIADVSRLDHTLVVGSSLRQEQPLLAARLRVAVRKGAAVSVVNAFDEDLAMPVTGKAIVPPSQLANSVAQLAVAVATRKGIAVPASFASIQANAIPAAINELAASFASAKNPAVFIGEVALSSAHASQIEAAVVLLAQVSGARWGRLATAANSVGLHLAGCVPGAKGLSVGGMVRAPRQAMIVWGNEPERDSAFGADALNALKAAASVIYCGAFKSSAAEAYADLMLPIAPFAETSGTFVNAEGTAQSFSGVVRAQGDARPGWKVLRVLSESLGITSNNFDSSEQARDAVLQGDISARLASAATQGFAAKPASSGVERIADVAIYHADSLTRNAESLQLSSLAKFPGVRLSPALASKLSVVDGQTVKVKQGAHTSSFAAKVDARLVGECIRLPLGLAQSAELGALDQPVSVERA